MDNLDKYLNVCAQPQSNYALNHFVDGAQLTTERKFKQCVMELDAAVEYLAESNYALDVLKLKNKKLKGKLYNVEEGSDDITLINLKIDRNYRKQKAIVRSIAGREREILVHEENLKSCEIELGFNKDTTEDHIYKVLQDAEADYYLIKLANDTAAHIVSNSGGPSAGVCNALQQMPEGDIKRFRNVLNGMLHSVSNTLYQPALHGIGSIADIEKLGADLGALSLAGDTQKGGG